MSRTRPVPPVPREPWDEAREPCGLAREPWDIAREPWDTAREPWDIGWLLHEDQGGGPRGGPALPPLGWGSPLVTKDTLLDHHHSLHGTWTREPAGTEGEELEAGGEPADLLVAPQEVESPRQYTVPVFSHRPLSRAVLLPRTTRKVRGRPGCRTVLVPWMYAPVFCQARSSPAEWSRQTPVSGGTGLKLTTDFPQASTGWYDQLNQQVEGQTRRNSPTYDWSEPCGDESSVAGYRRGSSPVVRPRGSSTAGRPRGGSTAGSRSTEVRTTYPPTPSSSVWEGEWTSWGTSPGLVTQTKQKSESHW